MSIVSHVQELKKKHQALSVEIEQAQRAPSTDDMHITELKKRKLRLKEEIAKHGI